MRSKYYTQLKQFACEKEMLEYLGKLPPIEAGVKIAIVGGHFMLLYDKVEDKLRPMVWQDLKKSEHIKYSKMITGNFPVHTFNYAVDLYSQYKEKGYDSGIVLLVNDHKFQHHNSKVNGNGGELRKRYYRNGQVIPESFLRILSEKSFDKQKIFIDYNKPDRQKQDLLPKETIMYSEQVLRNRFEKHIKPKIAKTESFKEITSNGVSNLYYYSRERHEYLCLTEEGTCGCSGEVVEFVSELLRRNIRQIILFSPSECEAPVNVGVEVALDLYGKISDKPAKALIIAGIGGVGGENMKENSDIRVAQHFLNC